MRIIAENLRHEVEMMLPSAFTRGRIDGLEFVANFIENEHTPDETCGLIEKEREACRERLWRSEGEDWDFVSGRICGLDAAWSQIRHRFYKWEDTSVSSEDGEGED